VKQGVQRARIHGFGRGKIRLAHYALRHANTPRKRKPEGRLCGATSGSALARF
jgi:hypothetical protein